jgi:CheY-like chemotaxis protein
MRILVVDDDPISRNIVREFLGSRGFEVDAAENAQAAIEKIRHGRYELLILDIFLPHRDGRSLHLSVTSMDPDLARKTIFISHWEPAGAIADYVGENGLFLKKPFSADDLMRGIQLATGVSPETLVG